MIINSEMKKVLITTVILLIIGCATSVPKVTTTSVSVTTNPSGASIYLYDANTHQETVLGTSPGNFNIPQGTLWVFLLAKLDGHESVKEMITSQKTSYVFNLEKDWMEQIFNEYLVEKKYDNDFVKKALDVVGTFNKAINSPRMLFASVYIEGETQLSHLSLDYPDMSSSALTRALQRCRIELKMLTMVGSFEHTPWEYEKLREIELLITKIKGGLLQ